MKTKEWIALPTLSLVAALAGGCSGTSDPGLDPKPVLSELVTNVMLPTLGSVDQRAEELRLAATTLAADPTEQNLLLAQEAWRKARKPWRQADAFRIGPAVTDSLAAVIDWWPASPTIIDGKIADTSSPLNSAAVESFGTNAKGFKAIEYLLFNNQGGNAAVLTSISGDAGARRRDYLLALAENLKTKTATLYAAWDPAAGNYAAQLTSAGAESKAFTSPKAAVDELVNQLVFQVENVSSNKLAKPAGLKSGGQVLPEEEESPRSDNSIEDMLDTLRSIQNIYSGTYGSVDGMGISDLVRARSEVIDSTVIQNMGAALSTVQAIPPPFRTALYDHPSEVDKAWAGVKVLKRSLGADAGAVLGVALKFSDNDGD